MRLLEKLLGIDKLVEKIDSIESRITDKNEQDYYTGNNKKINFISEYTSEPLLSIETLEDYSKENLKNPIAIGSRVNTLFQALPMVQIAHQNKIIEGAYKIVMPEGVGGKLMQHKNGLLGTPVIGSNGRIQGHAGLEKIAAPSMNPALIFTAMSFVTGQYFITQINSSLKSISHDVKQIIKILLDDKKSRNNAIYEFYLEIINNMDIVLDNSDIRISYLTNIQSTLIDLRQNIKFYERSIDDIIDEKSGNLYDVIDEKKTNNRINEADKKFKELNEYLIQRYFCLQLFVMGKILETQLAQIYDDEYIKRVIVDLEIAKDNADKYNKRIIYTYKNVFSKIEEKNWIWSSKDIFEKRDNIIKEIQYNNENFIKNYKCTINGIYKFIQFNKRENTFIIDGENLYMIED